MMNKKEVHGERLARDPIETLSELLTGSGLEPSYRHSAIQPIFKGIKEQIAELMAENSRLKRKFEMEHRLAELSEERCVLWRKAKEGAERKLAKAQTEAISAIVSVLKDRSRELQTLSRQLATEHRYDLSQDRERLADFLWAEIESAERKVLTQVEQPQPDIAEIQKRKRTQAALQGCLPPDTCEEQS